MAIREKAGKKNDAGYADLLNQLGMTYTTYGNYTEAEKYLNQSLELMKIVYGNSSANYANVLNNLAMVYEKCW
jgi:tetratricopeptide (TPR) repeat protein